MHSDQNQPYSQQDLLAWATALENYARDWDQCFEHKPSYYTQEFWYLFVSCITQSWRGQPLTVTNACLAMKVGSTRTREERIRKAVVDGYLEKRRSPDNGRETYLLPTAKLEAAVVAHLERTLLATQQALNSVREKQAQSSSSTRADTAANFADVGGE